MTINMILTMAVTVTEGNIVQSFGSWIRDSTPQRSISGKSLAWINSSTVLVNINLACLSPIKLFEVIAHTSVHSVSFNGSGRPQLETDYSVGVEMRP